MPVNGSVDWANEWLASLMWIAKVFGATLLGGTVAAWLVLSRTVWGRQFRRLALPYFRLGARPGGWRALVTLMLVLVLTIAAVRLDVLLSYTSSGLYTALQQRNPAVFTAFTGIFGVLAAAHVVRVLIDYLITQALVIRWRVWLTDRLVSDWLSGGAYHRGQFTAAVVDNPDQRIQEDIASVTSRSVGLGVGTVSSVISLASFSIILWQLSGPLPVGGGVVIPRAMIIIAYGYVLVASVIAFRIGRPLVRLTFLNEGLTGSFRYALVRLRDNSERIAFYRGEESERVALESRFGAVIANTWSLVFRSLWFQGYNLAVSQASVIIPLVIQAPRFFSGALTLGDVQQTASAFGQVNEALSFFRNSYDSFAGYRAELDRLTSLLDANDEARRLPAIGIKDGAGLEVWNLTVRAPDDEVLIRDLSLSLTTGSTLLVKGPSGTGKTTLLRSLAGLWPYADGAVRRPQGSGSLFLSQQPYLPLGTLRAALTYPLAPDAIDQHVALDVLHRVQLGHLAARLDEDGDWTRRLSPGEQQRLGFARVLAGKPRLVFLDEATSSVDESLEYLLYQTLRLALPQCIVVSIGHRGTLDMFHTERLELLGDGRWMGNGVASFPR
jgi:putative ATP-binding cassette transporter